MRKAVCVSQDWPVARVASPLLLKDKAQSRMKIFSEKSLSN
jgi:hypothetical protein